MGLFIDRQLNSVLTLEDQQDLQFSANDCVRVCVRDVGLSCEWVAVMITARGESFQTC